MTPDTIDHHLLDLSGMELLRRIRIHPRGLAEGTFAGPHKSSYRGTSVEFTDYRDYVDGDDIRMLDWKAYARTDRYYVRLYESERNLLSYLVIDTSGSMAYSGAVTRTASKLTYACRLAAAMGYLAIREGDEVGLSLVDRQVDAHMHSGRSWPHLVNMLQMMGEARAEGKTDLAGGLDAVYSMLRRRGILMVFSDFLVDLDSLFAAINLYRHSFFEILLFHVVHPEEIDFIPLPALKCFDPEERGRGFTVAPDVAGSLYIERFQSFLAQLESQAKAHGCEWYLARTDEDPYQFLKRSLMGR